MPLKNTTFQGVNLISVEPDAPVRQSDLKAAAGDIAGVKAHLFDNTETGHINHSGPGRGALMGIPLVNQYFGRQLSMDSGSAGDGGIKGSDKLWFPFILPPHHETDLIVELVGVGLSDFNPIVMLRSTANIATSLMDNDEEKLDLQGINASETSYEYRANLRNVTSNVPTLLIIQIDMIAIISSSVVYRLSEAGDQRVHSVIVRSARSGRTIPATPTNSSFTNSVKVYPPASGNHLEWFEHYDGTFSDLFAVNGYQARTLDQNINGLMESLTGAPVGGNDAYVHTESALNNPTRDRFRAFTRKTFTDDEPIPTIPIVSHNCGGIKNDGSYLVSPRATHDASPTTSEQQRGAFAPYFNVTPKGEWSIQLQLPDVPTGKIKYAALFGSSEGVTWSDVAITAQWVGLTPTDEIAPTAITGANKFAYVTQTLVAHTRDSKDRFRLFADWKGTGDYYPRRYCLLAVSVWVED